MMKNELFHDVFRMVAKQYAESPAIVWQGNAVSYAELDKRSDAIAQELSAGGVAPNDIVPITLERGVEWIAYSIGVMKAGAVYVPISPSTPPERLSLIMNDIKKSKAPDGAITIYYTSGSTGEPKGVILTHTGVIEFCKMHLELCGFSRGVRGGVQADVGFDSFLLTTLPILYFGGTLYLMDETERTSIVGMHRFLIKNKIEMIFLTTQFGVEYMRAFDNKHLKILMVGGEALRSYTPRSYTAYNIYGPTECTAYMTAHKLCGKDEGDIPIGKPTGQNKVYLIDGELCVSGPQLAAGYLNRPEETAQKFIPNPYYNPDTDADWYRRLYTTGDMAQWTEEGELLYRGRIDNMVKISGYRIEPGDVEIALSRHPGLSAACVIVRRNPSGEAYLSAYYVPCESGIDADSLKSFLAQLLPVYMHPHKFVELSVLPLNLRTGKVDVSALPES